MAGAVFSALCYLQVEKQKEEVAQVKEKVDTAKKNLEEAKKVCSRKIR